MAHVHIVGAGLAGLSCAVALCLGGHRVTVHEAAGHAGGRCRSYFDETLGCAIDNGNHLLLGANHAALGYLAAIGARDTLLGPTQTIFPFVDIRSGQRWTVRPNRGPLPWWIFAPSRRVPDTRPWHYLADLSLAFARPTDTVAGCIGVGDPLFERFFEPLCVAVLNTPAATASARLLWAVMLRTFARGAAGCRPLIARDGLSASLIDPALALLARRGASVAYNRRLRAIERNGSRIEALSFGADRLALGPDDTVVVAVPPAVAAALLPELTVPRDSHAIVNAHIRLPTPPRLSTDAPFLGVIGGTADWIFVRDRIVSLTVSAADALADRPVPEVARLLWHDTAAALDLPVAPTPPIRVIKERRATFAQTPAQVAQRPATETPWRNLLLAGDWTDTGLPATIESAITSGQRAAAHITAQ